LGALVAATVLAVMPSLAARQNTKTMYLIFLDDKGLPIRDLKAEEIAVAEDGQERQIVSAKLADTPASIIMLADTTKAAGGGGLDRRSSSASSAGEMIRDIRAALDAFSQEMFAANPQNELALMEFGQASIMVQNFTQKPDDISKAITKLFPKPDADSVLLEAIMESAKELNKRKNGRRAMVSINVEPGNEASREPPNNILRELGKSHAPLFSVSLQKGDSRNQSRGIVLPQLATQTGGHHETIVGQSALVGLLKTYAAAINAQYEITYTRPNGAAPAGFQAGVRRQGVTILASRFPPQ
jgi:hypothetical protein